MSDDVNTTDDASLAPPPPPPPPPPAARSRRHVIGRRGAAVAVASGLVVGGVAGGYVISQAATSSPSASASPSTAAPHNGHPGFAGGGPAARTQDMQQVAGAIGVTTTQLQTEMSAGKTIAVIAKEHNIDAATVVSTLVTDENSEIDDAVTAGTITSAQAAQMKTQTTQRVTDMVNGTKPAHGPGGPGGPRGMRAEDQQVIATAIGITATQLQTELTAGRTVAAIATDHNVTAATVVNALVSSENSEIDKSVSSGQITAAHGAQEKTQTQQRVTDEVNGTRPAGGPWGRHGAPNGGPPNAPAGSSSTN
jgi:ribosomal protein S20